MGLRVNWIITRPGQLSIKYCLLLGVLNKKIPEIITFFIEKMALNLKKSLVKVDEVVLGYAFSMYVI